MSSSTTYRSISVSSALREAIENDISQFRCSEQLAPALTQITQEHLSQIEAQGLITTDELAATLHEVQTSSSFAELHKICRNLPINHDTWTFEVTQARTEIALATIDRLQVSDDLHDSLRDITESLNVPTEGIHPGSQSLSTQRPDLETAAQLLDVVELEIDQRLLSDATQQAVAVQISAVFEELGYAVDPLSNLGADVQIHAKVPTGTVATANISSTENVGSTTDTDQGTYTLHLHTLDLGNAVAADAPEADEVCDPAVQTAVDIHERIDLSTTLTSGQVRSSRRPTRGIEVETDSAIESQKVGEQVPPVRSTAATRHRLQSVRAGSKVRKKK